MVRVRLRVKEIAKEKGISMGKLQRDADLAYNTVRVTSTTLNKIAKYSWAQMRSEFDSSEGKEVA